MSAEKSQVYLFDNHTGCYVDAELCDEISELNIRDWENSWSPLNMALRKKLLTAGIPMAYWPQSGHWSWTGKMQRIQGDTAHRSFSVTCAGNTQGMMIVDTTTKRCRLESQKGKNLVYVKYIETAPWNQKTSFTPDVWFSGTGKILMAAAIQLSINEEFKGRVGLHSLPQAITFYSRKCGMVDLGKDSQCEDLNYFEMTPDAAIEFLHKGGAQ